MGDVPIEDPNQKALLNHSSRPLFDAASFEVTLFFLVNRPAAHTEPNQE